MAKKRTLRVLEDNDTELTFEVTLSGVPYDLTGKTVEFRVKYANDDLEPFLILSSDQVSEVDVTDPTAGKGSVFLTASQTQDSRNKTYRLDVVGGGKRVTPVYGELLTINT